MKKCIFLIPVVGLMISCSGGAKQQEESSQTLQEQTEKIEKSIQNSEVEMEKIQTELDTLLNNI